VVGVLEADVVVEAGESVRRIGLREALPNGVDTDELGTLEVALEVAIEMVEPVPLAARFDTRLEASAGLMVVVVGGRLAVEPGARTMVRVTVPLPLAESPPSFEVILEARPPLTPTAPIRDRAFASLVHAMNYRTRKRRHLK
jgi:hypothetical protein